MINMMKNFLKDSRDFLNYLKKKLLKLNSLNAFYDSKNI